MNSMPPAWLAYIALVPTSNIPQPQAQARPRLGRALATANAIHEIFTIVSRMKISTGSAGEYRRCAYRLISDESGWTSGSLVPQWRRGRIGIRGRRSCRAQSDVIGVGRLEHLRQERRATGQCEGARGRPRPV